jgi:hypothetical protein
MTRRVSRAPYPRINAERAVNGPFTTDQMARLKAVFPKGVCDDSRPGVEQRRVGGSWKRY